MVQILSASFYTILILTVIFNIKFMKINMCKFQKMSKLISGFDSASTVSTIKAKLTVSIEPEFQVFLNLI